MENVKLSLYRVHPDGRRQRIPLPLYTLRDAWPILTDYAGREPEYGFELRAGKKRDGRRVATGNKRNIPGEGIQGGSFLALM